MTGRDAVVSALGPRPKEVRGQPVTVCSASARGIIQAARAAGVRRLVVVSAPGAFSDEADGPVTRLVVKPLVQRMLKETFADVRRMEELVRAATDLDWTIVRPVRLTNRPQTGAYHTATGRSVRRGLLVSVSRADLADCILRLLGDPGTTHTVVSVAN